jgi:hypothetical protein
MSRTNPFSAGEAESIAVNASHSPRLGRTRTPKRASTNAAGRTQPVMRVQEPASTPLTMSVQFSANEWSRVVVLPLCQRICRVPPGWQRPGRRARWGSTERHGIVIRNYSHSSCAAGRLEILDLRCSSQLGSADVELDNLGITPGVGIDRHRDLGIAHGHAHDVDATLVRPDKACTSPTIELLKRHSAARSAPRRAEACVVLRTLPSHRPSKFKLPQTMLLLRAESKRLAVSFLPIMDELDDISPTGLQFASMPAFGPGQCTPVALGAIAVHAAASADGLALDR